MPTRFARRHAPLKMTGGWVFRGLRTGRRGDRWWGDLSFSMRLVGLHVGAEDGVDTGLVVWVLAEPAEEVGVQAHGHDFFWGGQDEFGGLPECCVAGMGVGVGGEGSAVPPGRTFNWVG